MSHAIYCRISEDTEGLAAGVERQTADARALAARDGHTVPDELVFIDNDVSASTRSTRLRPEWNRLLELIDAGSVTDVWAYSSSRLTRRPAEFETLIELTEKRGVTFHTTTGAINLATADGRLAARIIGNADTAEAERTGERVARQKLERARKGLPQGGRNRLFGFTRTWEVVEEEAEIVREVFARRADGESVTGIATDLAGRGLVTVPFVCRFHSDRWPADKLKPKHVPELAEDCDRCKPGVPWRHQSLVKTLGNPTYAGLREYKGEVIGSMRDGFPVIVKKDLFDAVQLVTTASASPGTNTRRYLLTSIARCADCGGRMKGAPSSRRVARYRCAATYGGCGKTSIRCDWIDYEIEIRAYSAEIVSRGEPEDTTASDLAAEAGELRSELSMLQAAVNARELSMATALPMLRTLEDRLRETETAVTKAAVRKSSNWVFDEFGDLLGLPLSARRAVIARHVSAVVISRGETRGRNTKDLERVEVHYSDGTVERLVNETPATTE